MTQLWSTLGVLGLLFAVGLVSYGRKRHVVRAWQTGLLYRDGRFVRVLSPGRHTLSDLTGRSEVVHVQTGEQAVQLGPVDAFSSDGFAFRLSLSLTYTVVDAQAFHESTAGNGATFGGVRPPGFDDALTAAATAAAARHSLAETLADPQVIGAEILTETALRAPSLSLAIVLVSRVQLPPETRKLLGEVEATRLQGLASLERARAEQAALRSLANAARLLRDNPELAQLRLLQTVENAKRPATIILGQPGAPIGAAPPVGLG